MGDLPAHAVRPLKEAGRRSVWLIQRPSQAPRTLKRWGLGPGMLVKLALGIAQPQRQVAGARLLAGAGIPTPRLAGGWRVRWRKGPVVELEIDYVEGRSALDLARDPGLRGAELRRVSEAVGRLAASMVSAGLFNRDMILANLVIDEQHQAWQIDTVDVRRAGDRAQAAARLIERLSIQLPVMRDRLVHAAWMPGLRRILRALTDADRARAIRWLRAHRRRRSG
jgi:hypothetical protein